MHANHIPDGLRLCRAAGWNQIARDWEILLNHSANDCFVATIDSQVVGTVVATRYDSRLAWIGMVLVDPKYRRQGLGTLLLRHILAHLGDSIPIGLDATPAGREVYLKLDFVDVCSLARFECDAVTAPYDSLSVRPMNNADLGRISAYDTNIFGTSRDDLLRWWYDGAPQHARVDSRQDICHGFCLGRAGYAYHQLGPIIAEDSAMCRQLVGAAFATSPEKRWIIDVPTVHTEFINWLKERGFREQRTLIRMVRGGTLPNYDLTRQFAVMAPELG
jgi:GNAT superfamily N-acetyltransferase